MPLLGRFPTFMSLHRGGEERAAAGFLPNATNVFLLLWRAKVSTAPSDRCTSMPAIATVGRRRRQRVNELFLDGAADPSIGRMGPPPRPAPPRPLLLPPILL